MKLNTGIILRRAVAIIFVIALLLKILHLPYADMLILISGVAGVVVFYPKINSFFRRLESREGQEE